MNYRFVIRSMLWAALLVLTALTASPATFTVNSTSDDAATDGTFRKAILDANTTPEIDAIQFAIDNGPQTITIRSNLPPILAPLTIDGSTQPDFAGSPLITIRANNGRSTTEDRGLTITTSNCTVRAINVQTFQRRQPGAGIVISNGVGNTIVGCFLGTDDQGTNAGFSVYCNVGLLIENGASNVLGGVVASDRNIFSSGNGAFPGGGVGCLVIRGSASMGNQVLGNYFNIDRAGLNTIAASADALRIEDAPANQIGNSEPGARNLFRGTVILTGTASNNVGGGTAAGAGNVIGGGLSLRSSDNQVFGNIIGLDPTGANRATNSGTGVFVSGHRPVPAPCRVPEKSSAKQSAARTR